jgi:hypothetical protein
MIPLNHLKTSLPPHNPMENGQNPQKNPSSNNRINQKLITNKNKIEKLKKNK